jgi:hypothetical protein
VRRGRRGGGGTQHTFSPKKVNKIDLLLQATGTLPHPVCLLFNLLSGID